MPKKIFFNGNARPIRHENRNGAIAIQYDGNIVLIARLYAYGFSKDALKLISNNVTSLAKKED